MAVGSQPSNATLVHVVTITTNDPVASTLDVTVRPRQVIRRLSEWLAAFAAGAKLGTVDLQDGATTTAVKATGTLTIASGSGSVGGAIGGTSVTVTWGTSDTASAAALAVAINANTTVNKWVVATSLLGVVTLTATVAGAIGNLISLTASGTGVTRSAALFTGGVNPTAASLTW